MPSLFVEDRGHRRMVRFSDDRSRLLAGMGAALREHAYADVTVADVVRHAKTSRRTFYEHFASRDTCLVALLRQTNERVLAAIVGGVDPHTAWQEQVEQALVAWIAAVNVDPAVTLSWIRVSPLLGEEGRALSREMGKAYADLIGSLVSTSDHRGAGVGSPTPAMATLLVGGLRELIAVTVEDGHDIAGLVPAATDFVVRLLEPGPS